MVDIKTINSVNKIGCFLGDAAIISMTWALGSSAKDILCKPNIKITDLIIAAAIVGFDFKLCVFINDAKKELVEENNKLIKSYTEDGMEKFEYEKRI